MSMIQKPGSNEKSSGNFLCIVYICFCNFQISIAYAELFYFSNTNSNLRNTIHIYLNWLPLIIAFFLIPLKGGKYPSNVTEAA